MCILVVALFALHGSIHLLGFLKAFGLAALPQLTSLAPRPLAPASLKLLGVFWLIAAVVLVASAIGLALRWASWWWLAAAGVVLSQVMIVCAWDAAKMGSVLNLTLAIPVLMAGAEARFQASTESIVRDLLAGRSELPGVVRSEDLRDLPEPVVRWLTGSGIVGRPHAVTVRLTQTGALRTAPDGPWLPSTAEQIFRIDEPGFVWRVRTRMFGLPVAGRDVYREGRGHMTIKLGALVPVVDAKDARIDQGTLQRYLGEIVWFPSAALRDYIEWEPVDANSARATMRYRGVSGSAVFSFDAEGRVTEVSARRYFGGGEAARQEDWRIPIRTWQLFGGVRVPAAGDVIWKLPEGDFNYFDWKIASLEINPPLREGRDAQRDLHAEAAAPAAR